MVSFPNNSHISYSLPWLYLTERKQNATLNFELVNFNQSQNVTQLNAEL